MAVSSGNKKETKKIIRHDWSQTHSEIILTLFPGVSAKLLKKDDIQVETKDRSIAVSLPGDQTWNCDLNQSVMPEFTSVQQKSNKIIIKMMKTNCETWNTLEPQKIESNAIATEEKVEVKENPKLILELDHLKHDIYEKSPEFLTLSIYVKSIAKDSLDVSFLNESFSIKFHTSDKQFLTLNKGTVDTTFVWNVALKAGIKPDLCNFKVTDTKLELIFVKKVPKKWNTLEEAPQKIRVVEVPTSTWISAVDTESQDPPEAKPLETNTKPTVVGYVDKIGKSALNEERKDVQKPTCMVSPLNPKTSVSSIMPGFTGLENLGNTCFMNSVLQCLANTRELRDYFKDGRFKDDINVSNPLGMQGQLALAFAVLLRHLWMGSQSSCAPSKLKMLIAKKATQFSGFAQHDAQEFMAFFLDGLHEDLNRVKDKPYIENAALDNRPDEVAAEEAWKNYKKRNDSVVVDLFQGQYKSKLVCPVCEKVSITFDPFLYLSLPLPKDCIICYVHFFHKDPRPKPVKFKLCLSSDSSCTVYHLLKKVSLKSNISPVNLRLFVFRQDKLQSLIASTPLSNVIGINKIFVFEVYDEKLVGEPVVEIMVQQRLVRPPISNICPNCLTKDSSLDSKLKRCTKCMRVAYCNVECQRAHWNSHKNNCHSSWTGVGLPFLFSLPKSQTTYSVVYRVLEGFSRHSVDVFQPPVSSQSPQCRSHQLSTPSLHKNPSRAGSPTSACNDQSLETEKAMSELNLADLKPDLPSECQPVRIVIGQQADHYPYKSQFTIRQLDCNGIVEGEVIQENGNEPILDLECTHLAMDWRNEDKLSDNILVQSKDLDCESDSTNDNLYDDNPSLDECLKLFTEPEILTSKDAWYCPKCKEHREATKQLSLWRLPPILIVQLKRFSYGGILHFRDKLDKMINFPIRGLDISPYVCPTQKTSDVPLYDLYGVVNHQGGILGGHYTSYTRTVDFKDSRRSEVDWRLCDDSRVLSVRESAVVSEAAYVLFYRQRGFQFCASENITVPVKIENKNKVQKQLENELDLREEMPFLDSNIVYYAGVSGEPCTLMPHED